MIAVVDYKKGNLLSVERGLRAAGADARITDDAAEIVAADAIVLPGVGAFADAAATMDELGQTEVIRRRIAQGVPFLGICLGEHLLFEEGAEGAGADGNPRGLGVMPGCVDRMPRQDAEGRAYKVPHVGWNTVDFPRSFLEPPLRHPSGTYFYFTHSYIAPGGPFAIAHTTHSVTFPCAVQKGNAFGVQFHPEKSSDAGAAVLRNFVDVKAASPALQG